MLFFLAALAQLLFLFFLSRELTRRLSYALFRIVRSKKYAVFIFAFLFFPGTLIHELAHFFMALILFVRTGEINLFPKLEQDHVRLGSVQVAKSDPIRKFFIGVSPIIVGTLILLVSLLSFQTISWLTIYWKVVIEGYILFEVGNTMFSSKKDVEGALELLGAVTIIVVLLYVVGIHIPFQTIFSGERQMFLKTCNYLLLIPLAIDGIVIVILKTITKY